MSIVLLRKSLDSDRWLTALQAALPHVEIAHYDMVKVPEKVDFLITFKPTKQEIQRFPNLKVIQSIGSGVNYIIDTHAVTDKMILSRMVDPYLANDMWEFVLGAVLAQLKNFPAYRQLQQQHKWYRLPYRRIEDTTVCILGLGKIGGYVAKRFATMGFKVKGWSNSAKHIEGVDSYHGKAQLPKALSNVDFLISILPLTKATTGILNRENLIHLPKGAFVINVGRGGSNHETDLLYLLNQHHLSGILLDVFATEPLPKDHPFWSHPQVTIIPHSASITNVNSAVDVMVDNYQRFLAGLPLKNVVSIEKGY